MAWLLVAVAFVIAVYALVHRSVWWLIGSAVFYAPFVFYLGSTPRFWYAPFLLIFYLLAGIALRTHRYDLAWILMSPIVIFTIYVGMILVIGWYSTVYILR